VLVADRIVVVLALLVALLALINTNRALRLVQRHRRR
jgi:hypothetical protein